MRTSTLAKMLLLSGLTAAAAGIGTAAPPQDMLNNMANNSASSNTTMPDPVPANEMAPPAPRPSPSPNATPGVTTNELSPKPM